MENYINIDNEFSVLTERQVNLINEPTPIEFIEVKTDESGAKTKSVTGFYVKQRLNLIFGFNYSFQIIEQTHHQMAKEVVVLGRLTIKTDKGDITREQFGRHKLSTVTISGKKYGSDIGDGFKSAATDALKKCASELGICWDIYGAKKEVVKNPNRDDEVETRRLEKFLSEQTTLGGVKNIERQFLSNVPNPTDEQIELIELAKYEFLEPKLQGRKPIP